MGPLGWQETVFIFILALLIFGPKKLPELGKTIGKALTEFRRASSDLRATFDREIRSIEKEGDSLREITSSYQNELYDSSHDSSYNYDSSDNYGYGDYDYSSDSSDSTATSPSTASASAPQGAESTASGSPDSEPAPAGSTEQAGSERNEASGGDRKPAASSDGTAQSESQAVPT